MAACQVCISGISIFVLEHPTAANSKNFNTDEWVHLTNQLRQLESIHQTLRLMKWSGKQLRKKPRRERDRPQKTITEEMLVFQMEKFNYQKEQDPKNWDGASWYIWRIKKKSMQKNDKKIVIFSWNLEKYLVEINNCFQHLNHSIKLSSNIQKSDALKLYLWYVSCFGAFSLIIKHKIDLWRLFSVKLEAASPNLFLV